ncbi:hypothetical protein OCA97_14755 [Bacillus cereus]|nr:hypothetical protein [Bacillus cereus]
MANFKADDKVVLTHIRHDFTPGHKEILGKTLVIYEIADIEPNWGQCYVCEDPENRFIYYYPESCLEKVESKEEN